MTMMACAAGKDVYVEKPLTLVSARGAVDGRRRPAAQPGRPGRHAAAVGAALPEGARADPRRPHRPGRRGPDVVLPQRHARASARRPTATRRPELDYDLWLGPAPKRPYNPNRSIYHFRWFWDYSGGQMTNLGQHSLDIVHWFLDATAPTAVTSAGGRFALKDNGETPDTQDALFEYPGWTATWSHRECSRGAAPASGLEFCGTRGSLKISRKGFVVTPDPKVAPDELIPRFGGPHPVGGPATTGQREVAGEADRRRRGPFRRRVRPVQAPRPQLPRVRPVAPRPDLGPGERAPRRHRLPPGEPVAPAGPEAPLGRRPRDGRRRPRGRGHARTAVPGALGRRAQCPAPEGDNSCD